MSMMISDLKGSKAWLNYEQYDKHSVQFSSVQKIIQTIDDKYYNNRSNLSAIYNVYSMSKLYAITCSNYALLIRNTHHQSRQAA